MMFNYVALVCYVGLSNRQCSCRSFELFSDLSLFRYIRSSKQAIILHVFCRFKETFVRFVALSRLTHCCDTHIVVA